MILIIHQAIHEGVHGILGHVSAGIVCAVDAGVSGIHTRRLIVYDQYVDVRVVLRYVVGVTGDGQLYFVCTVAGVRS